MVANQHDVGEAMLAKALRRAGQHALEGGLGNRDGAGKAHVLGRWGDVALRHIGHHRGHQRVAQLRGDALGQHLDAGVVLAQREVRAALLGAAHGDDQCGFAGFERGAHFGGGQVVQGNAAGRPRGVGADQQQQGGGDSADPVTA